MLASLPPAGLSPARSPAIILGTDDLGRDVLSRLIYGARIALIVAFVAASLAAIVGTTLGLLAGWYRGWVDGFISRLVDIWMAFPPVLLSILLRRGAWRRRRIGHRGDRHHRLDALLPGSCAPIRWRKRKPIMSRRRTPSAFPPLHILMREILPNIVPALLALVSLEMGIAVIVEAILSFVGLSVSSDTPTWGGMIAEGRQFIHQTWWVFAAPLAALFATVLAFNQLGDGLRRALDPVLRR